MNYPLVRFVAAPEPDAAVRFDFNSAGSWADDETWPDHDGFSIGAPSVEGDPTGVGVEYGYRSLEFNLIIRGSRTSALRQQSALAREVMRSSNWLVFQLSAFNKPVWFKTYRSEPGALDFEHVYLDNDVDTWGVGVSLTADPFAYGERVTLPAVTIANDPTAATNPMSYVLPEIVGDAPAPLTMRLHPDDSTWGTLLANVTPVDDTFDGPYVWQSADFNAKTDASAETADALYSGGGYRSVTFTTDASMVERFEFSMTTPKSPPAGRYLLFARVGRSDTSSEFKVKLGTAANLGGNYVYQSEATISGTSDDATWQTWVPLGDFSIPRSIDLARPDGVTSPVFETLFGSLAASRTSGTGSLRVDAIMAVPFQTREGVGASLEAAGFETSYGYTLTHLMVDGDSETVQYVTLGIGYYAATNYTPPLLGGGFPTAHPGATNVLHLLLHASGESWVAGFAAVGDTVDHIATQTTVEISYRPRWLYLGAD